MSVLMSESFINSFKRLIHSETSQLTALMNGSLNQLTRFVQKHGFVQKRNTAVCCSETHNSSAVALIATIFVGEIEQKQSIFCLKSKSLNFNLLFIEILLCKISHIAIVLILLIRETSWPSNVAYLNHIL